MDIPSDVLEFADDLRRFESSLATRCPSVSPAHPLDAACALARLVGTKQRPPVAPWLEALLRYVERLERLEHLEHLDRPEDGIIGGDLPLISLWSPLHFVVLDVGRASVDARQFSTLLDAVARLLSVLVRERIDRVRTEQYGVRFAAAACVDAPSVLLHSLVHAETLAADGADPGWFLQLTFPKLWTRTLSEEVFERTGRALVAGLGSIAKAGVSVGYPMAVGLSALAEYAPGFETHWPAWMEVLTRVACALPSPYAVFEYGLPAIACSLTSGEEMLAALEVVITLQDHGIEPLPTMQRVLSSSRLIDWTRDLALRGINPVHVLTGGLSSFTALGWMNDDTDDSDENDDDGRQTLFALAENLHSAGVPTQQTFQDGLPVLVELEAKYPGLARVAFEIVEAMADRGLNPGRVLCFGLGRVEQAAQSRWPFVMEDSLRIAARIVAMGVDPYPVLAYAVRSIAEVAQGDRDEFDRLSRTLEDLVSALVTSGAGVEEVLLYDVRGLIDASGKGSRVFSDLAQHLAGLLGVWRNEGLDPKKLVTDALPKALWPAVGRAWVVSEAIDCATKLAREGRADHALVLLERGVNAALALTAERDAFKCALAALAGGYRRLPSPFWASATRAAEVVEARGDQLGDAIDRMFALFARGLERSAARGLHIRDAVAEAFPAMMTMCVAVDDLSPLFDVFIGSAETLSPALLSVWCSGGLFAIAGVAKGQPSSACALIEGLAAHVHRRQVHPAQTTTVPETAQTAMSEASVATLSWVLERALLTLSRSVRIAPSDFLAVADGLAEIGARFRDAPNTSTMLLSLLETASDGAECRKIQRGLLTAFASEAETHAPLVEGLSRIHGLVAYRAEAWPRLILPTLESHRRHAGPILSALAWVQKDALSRDEDLDVLRALVTQLGVRTRSVIEDLIEPAVRHGIVRSLAEHEALLRQFVHEVGFFDVEIYRRFVTIRCDRTAAEAEKKVRVEALRREIDTLTEAIRRGDLDAAQWASPLLGVALSSVFPPAMTATTEMYERLVRQRADRPQDARKWDAKDLRRATVDVASGGWDLDEGVEIDRAPWLYMAACLDEACAIEAGTEAGADTATGTSTEARVVRDRETEILALGWSLLCAWSEGHIGRSMTKRPLVVRLLALCSANRERFGMETASQLIALSELASDVLREQIETCLLAARDEDPLRYRRLVEGKLNPPPAVGARLLRNVVESLEAWREGRVENAEAKRRLRGQLRAFSVDDAQLEALRAVSTPEAAESIIMTLGGRANENTANNGAESERRADDREVARLHADLMGQDVQAMRRTLFGDGETRGCVVFRADAGRTQVTFEVTKRRAHAAVGLSEGVCVVYDDRLWNNPNFLQLIFWSEEGRAQGGAHLLIVEDDGGSFLTLPGINPAADLLGNIRATDLVDALIRHAFALADAWSLRGVWIPVQRNIHSNRQAIQTAVAARSWPTRHVRSHTLSYAPFAYSFSEVFDVPRPPEARPGPLVTPGPSRSDRS